MNCLRVLTTLLKIQYRPTAAGTMKVNHALMAGIIQSIILLEQPWACAYSKKQKSIWLKQAIIVSAVVLSTAIGILGAKSLTEAVLYSLPFAVRVATNFFAFVADIVVLIIGFELCLTHESLSKRVACRYMQKIPYTI